MPYPKEEKKNNTTFFLSQFYEKVPGNAEITHTWPALPLLRFTQENVQGMQCDTLSLLVYVQIVHNWWMWKEMVINKSL